MKQKLSQIHCISPYAVLNKSFLRSSYFIPFSSSVVKSAAIFQGKKSGGRHLAFVLRLYQKCMYTPPTFKTRKSEENKEIKEIKVNEDGEKWYRTLSSVFIKNQYTLPLSNYVFPLLGKSSKSCWIPKNRFQASRCLPAKFVLCILRPGAKNMKVLTPKILLTFCCHKISSTCSNLVCIFLIICVHLVFTLLTFCWHKM